MTRGKKNKNQSLNAVPTKNHASSRKANKGSGMIPSISQKEHKLSHLIPLT